MEFWFVPYSSSSFLSHSFIRDLDCTSRKFADENGRQLFKTTNDQFKHGLRAATKKFWCATSKIEPDPTVEPNGKDASCGGGGLDKEKIKLKKENPFC